jgi:hypothetical protein
LNGSLLRQLGCLGPPTQKVEQCGIAVGEVDPSFRSSGVHDSFVANKLPGQAERTGGNFGSRGILGSESKQICGGDSCWKHGLSARSQLLHCRGIWTALAKRGLPSAIINPLAQSIDGSGSCEPGECLRDSGEWKVAEVVKPPKVLATTFDALADQSRDLSRGGGCGMACHA